MTTHFPFSFISICSYYISLELLKILQSFIKIFIENCTVIHDASVESQRTVKKFPSVVLAHTNEIWTCANLLSFYMSSHILFSLLFTTDYSTTVSKPNFSVLSLICRQYERDLHQWSLALTAIHWWAQPSDAMYTLCLTVKTMTYIANLWYQNTNYYKNYHRLVEMVTTVSMLETLHIASLQGWWSIFWIGGLTRECQRS